ncbi:MAG: ATPase, T2SS/T4P/T4SS family [Pyrobaculum sp.]
MSLLLKIFECLECTYSCREKDICKFSQSEIPYVIKLVSRIFRKTVDDTIDFRYRFFKKVSENLAEWATLETFGLGEIAEFIKNREVEDILLIPGRPIYLTTRRGKIKISKTTTPDLVSQILKIAYMKGIELTTSNPSFRYSLKFGHYTIRVSVDLPPIVPLPQAYVRIHRGKITLSHLLNSGFLTKSQLIEIGRYVKEGRNIVVSGPPGSGKTTLLSAIDDLIPQNFQRVYIDEADEFEDDEEKNQIKIRNVDKLREIYTSLNRNIDVVIIGELQYEGHFVAYKTSVEMGIQTLATMHASNIKDAIKRLERYVEVKNMAIIQLEKKYSATINRRVVDIYAQ